MKILIIEDEPGLQLGLRDLFEETGYECRVSGEGKAGLQLAQSWSPNLIVLDLGLPDIDGTLVLEQLRGLAPMPPVLVLTARANEADVVLGFKLGAFDYVTKPFSPRILRARAEALLQRQGKCETLQLGDILVDFDRYEAFRDGEPLHLTTREVDILRYLKRYQGKPVTRNDILDEVWGLSSEAGPRTVDTHIALLRKKIEPNPEKPLYLLSQRGIGYKLAG